MTHAALTCLAACCHVHSLSCPGRDQLKSCCLSQSGPLCHDLVSFAAMPAVVFFLQTPGTQPWADRRCTAKLFYPSIPLRRAAVSPATCLRRSIQPLDRQDEGGTRGNSILLWVMFSSGIKSLSLIFCDVYPPLTALFHAVLFRETE